MPQTITNAGGGQTIIPTTPATPPIPNVNATTPIDATSLSSNTSSFALPPAPSDGSAGLASTISSIPTIASIVGQENNPTPAEATNDKLNETLTAAEGQEAGKTTATTNAENAAGLPALNSQLTDLNSQITTLQNQANTIPLQVQQDATGRGVTSTAANTEQTGLLRQNTIKALGLSSLASALQGNIATAQSQADAAVKAQFDPIEAQISYLQDAITNNKDQMTKEEQEQADSVQAQLADRTNQIAQQKDDMSTILALATAAVTNNPGNQAAQLAAQQALKTNDLNTAFQLLGQYQAPAVQQTVASAISSATNDPSTLDPNSQSILAQTGLSVAAFNYLTQGTSALSRLSAADRQAVFNEAEDWLNKNGVDLSTFQSQYKAYTDTLQTNITRANQTQVFAGEVSGTVDQFVSDIGSDFGGLKAANVTELLINGQTNDPTAQKYAFDLQTMQNDLAGYYAASRGASQPDDADLRAASNVITNGINAGSAGAFKSSIAANETKVTGVVNQAVDNAHKQVWTLFGVGDKYQAATSGDMITVVSSNGQTGTVPKSQLGAAFAAGYSLPVAPMDHI
jgi:hypothetical protein